MKAVGLLEGGECGRAFDEFGRGGELQPAARGQIGGQVVEASTARKARQIVADRDDPGVVGGRRIEPDEMVRGTIEAFYLGIALRGIRPGRIGFAVEKEGTVAGVFGIDVDLSGKDRRAHDVGRPELDLLLDRQPTRFEHRGDHLPEQRALGIDL